MVSDVDETADIPVRNETANGLYWLPWQYICRVCFKRHPSRLASGFAAEKQDKFQCLFTLSFFSIEIDSASTPLPTDKALKEKKKKLKETLDRILGLYVSINLANIPLLVNSSLHLKTALCVSVIKLCHVLHTHFFILAYLSFALITFLLYFL